MKTTFRLLFLALCASFLFSCSNGTKESEWKLVWSEEFNDGQIDTTIWSKIPRGKPDWKNYMSDYEGCFDFRDGNLILRGIVNDVVPSDTAQFLTGGLYTKDKKTFQNGRLEIRAKLHGAKGEWPAIWMLPNVANRQWPKDGEIDIMERLNHDDIAYQTVHTYYTLTLGIKEDPLSHSTGKINVDDYNVYAVELDPDKLVFYINGEETFTYPRIETDKEGQFPFDAPFYLLIDMQLGGEWVGQVDPAELPVEMEVDWVRFYQK